MMKKLIVLTAVVFMTASIGAGAAVQAKQLTGVVNINTATAAELVLLPGIGKAKADAIIAYRQTAPFKAVKDLDKVKGIGPKMLEKIQQYVTIEGPTTARLVKAQPTVQVAQPAQKSVN